MGILKNIANDLGIIPKDKQLVKASDSPIPTGLIAGTNVRNGMFEQVVDPRTYMHAYQTVGYFAMVVDKVVSEAAKEGGEFKPLFAAKCDICGVEYDNKIPKQCSCGNTQLTLPDKKQLEYAEELLLHPNPDKSGKDLLKDLITYNQIIDDFYTEVVPDKYGRPAELYSLPAEYIRKAGDPQLEESKNKRDYFCPKCYEPGKDKTYSKGQTCFSCGGDPVKTEYVQLEGSGNDVIMRWAAKGSKKGEEYASYILHGNTRAFGTRVYGIPKVASIWSALQILRWMELYQWSSYSDNKTPDTFIAFPGMAMTDVTRMFEATKLMKANDPGGHTIVGVGVKEPPTVVNTMPAFKDMLPIDMANYLREEIALRFGIGLTMMGVQTPGKLGNETEVMSVSYDTIQDIQDQFNEFINTQILTLYPEITDWEYELITPLKDDVRREEEVRGLTFNNLAVLRASGIDAILSEDLDEIEVRGQPSPQSPQYGQTPGSYSFRVSKDIEKALTPRGIPADEAVPGLRALEDEFLKSLQADYDKGVNRIIREARTGGASRKELEALVAQYNKRFIVAAQEKARLFAQTTYAAGLERELKSLGVDRKERFTQRDLAAIKLLEERPEGLINTLKTFGEQQTDLINGAIQRAYSEPGEFSMDRMVQEMERLTGGEKYKLERIARSETTRISNYARKSTWEEYADPEAREYEWVVAQFGTAVSKGTSPCPICSDIAAGNPYVLGELEAITNGFLPHPNCKCTVVRRPLKYGGGEA